MDIRVKQTINNIRTVIPCNTKECAAIARQLTDDSEIWVAVESLENLQVFTFNGYRGLRIQGGPVLQITGMTWNDMLATCAKEGLPYPAPGVTKIGMFEDVYRAGYIIFPLVYSDDLNGEPLMLRKGRR